MACSKCGKETRLTVNRVKICESCLNKELGEMKSLQIIPGSIIMSSVPVAIKKRDVINDFDQWFAPIQNYIEGRFAE